MLSLPLWVVSERNQKSPPVHPPCHDPEAMLAFSTTEKLIQFLSGRVAGEWKLALASDREGLIVVIAVAHDNSRESICLDPEADGSGGEQIALNDLMRLANSLRQEP